MFIHAFFLLSFGYVNATITTNFMYACFIDVLDSHIISGIDKECET